MRKEIWLVSGLVLLCVVPSFPQLPGAKKNPSSITPTTQKQATPPNQNDASVQSKVTDGKYFIEVVTLTPNRVSQPSCADYLPEGENRWISAPEVARLVGAPIPFSVVPRGNRELLIYSNRSLCGDDKARLKDLENSISTLSNLRKFEIELAIPHNRNLGDLGSKIASLNYSQFSVQAVGPDQIRVSADSAPECEIWKQFLTDVRDLAWRAHPVSPVERVFYSNATDVAAILNKAAAGGSTSKLNSAGADSPGTPGGGQRDNSAPARDGSASAGSRESSAKTGGGQGKAGAGATATGAGAGKTDDEDAANGGSKDSDKLSPAQAANPGGSGQSGQKSPPVLPSASGTPDMLVYSEPVPGDDDVVDEGRRMVAMLDLPRPEMIVNVWTTQASTSDKTSAGHAIDRVRDQVADFNQRLQAAVMRGWEVIARYAAAPAAFYDEAFYKYIAYRYIADSPPISVTKTNHSVAKDYLEFRNRVTLDDATRDAWGVCPIDRYCLGYTAIFHPVKPRLTDLLLAVIAAADGKAQAVASEALDAMEGGGSKPARQANCLETDLKGYEQGPGPLFECFRDAASVYLIPESLALLRSSLANFLFHYKTAIQYPHEFSSYDLGQSAQAVNTTLHPMVDAFNADLRAFQSKLESQITRADETVCGRGKAVGDAAKCFQDNGIVTVRTVSGNETIVNTATQSYLDVTTAPTVAQLLNSMKQAAGNVPAVIGNNLGSGAAATLTGALNAMESTSSKIGRGLKVDFVPRSLPGASAAEIDVTLSVGETAEPALYTAGQASNTNDELSRVARHNTQTKMRVNSLNIFEVSSLSAQLLRARTRFPLLPLPGVEIPYIGSLVGIPRRPASEYHSSIAVLSALVVPTAADLAYGMRFSSDSIVQSETAGAQCSAVKPGPSDCTYRSPVSAADLGHDIWSFHRAMVACIATGMKSVAPHWSGSDQTAVCQHLTFAGLPSDAR